MSISKENKKALSYMLASTFLFAIMNIIVKHLAEIPVAQIVFMRSIVMFVMILVMVLKQGIYPFGTRKNILVLRGFCGVTGLAAFFYIIHAMPLATAVTVHYLTPLVTILISVLITRVRVTPLRWFFFALCFAGIFVIKGFDERVEVWPLVIGVLGTISAASAYNIISLLKKTEHHLIIMLYFPLVAVPVVLVYLFFTGEWVWTTPYNWMLLTVIGVGTYFAQYLLTIAYQIGDVSKVSVVSYTGVVFALFFGFVLFDEWYSPIVFVGLVMVLVGVLGNIFYKGNLKDIS